LIDVGAPYGSSPCWWPSAGSPRSRRGWGEVSDRLNDADPLWPALAVLLEMRRMGTAPRARMCAVVLLPHGAARRGWQNNEADTLNTGLREAGAILLPLRRRDDGGKRQRRQAGANQSCSITTRRPRSGR
jgi:hypothetical protein